VTPSGIEPFRAASTTPVTRRGLASIVERFGPVGSFRPHPPRSAAGTRLPGRRGNHVATRTDVRRALNRARRTACSRLRASRDRCYRIVAMTVSRKVLIAVTVAAGVIACAGRARAQTSGPPPTFRVALAATPSGTTIVSLRGPGVDVECGERCALELPQGSYKLKVKDAQGRLSTKRLDVTMPIQATVTPPDRDRRVLGITSFVVGMAATGVGVAILYVAMAGESFANVDCETNCTHAPPSWMWYAGGISLGAGLAVAMTGLALWQHNAHAIVRADALVPAPAKDARVRITPTVGRQGAGLALTARF
jgi:hypothetical protein